MTIDYVSEEGVCVITLNRPESLNAVNAAMRQELSAAFRKFEADRDARVAILTGKGRAFCAGVDIKASLATGALGINEPEAEDNGPFWIQNELEKPVIAAVNGYAMGVGFILSILTADLCIAAESAVFQMSEVSRGMIGGWEWGWQQGWSKQVCMEVGLGYHITAQRAWASGMIAEITSSSDLMKVARARAKHLLSIPPQVVKAQRELVRALRPDVPQKLLEISEQYRMQVDGSEDQQEAVRSWLEKRVPQYKDY